MTEDTGTGASRQRDAVDDTAAGREPAAAAGTDDVRASEALGAVQRAIVLVAERAGGAVVAIRGRGRGSGVVVAPGKVLTNAHNVTADGVEVTFADGRVADGAVAGVDRDRDLAVLSVDTAATPALAWHDAPELGLGQVVFALAATSSGPRVTWGTVSAVGRVFRGPRGRRITGAVEHTAPLARGSSGGPLVGSDGRLLAVNTHRPGDGFYLAVPAGATLRERVEALGRGEQPSRVRLGVALAPTRVARELRAAVGLSPRDGLLVRGVEDGSPAADAGLRQGDLLVEAAGRALRGLDDVFAVLDDAAADGAVVLGIVRGEEEQEVRVAFGAEGEDG